MTTETDDYKRYICKVCGYIYDEAKGDPDSGLAPGTRFEDIPDDWYCPDCNVTKADFSPFEPRAESTDAVSAASAWSGPRGDDPDAVVIVGAGMAGWALAERLRELDPRRTIRMITADSGDYYTKPRLSNAFGRETALDELVEEGGQQRAGRLGVELMPFLRVLGIDRDRQRVITARGGIPYGQLVLATGARPRHIDFPGDAAAPLSVNTLDDYCLLREALEAPGKSPAETPVAIIGAGLVGCELADDLARGGFPVALIECAEQPLAGLLPSPMSRDLAAALENRGVDLRLDANIARLNKGESGTTIELQDGEPVQAEVVLSALGLEGQNDIARAAGLDCGLGIRVNAQLVTSDASIFALGDGCEFAGRLRPYVETLRDQAAVLARTLCGEVTEYVPGSGTVQVKTASLPLNVCPPRDVTRGTWVETESTPSGRQLEFHADGVLAGFAVSGSLARRAAELETRLGQPVGAERPRMAS